MFLWYRFVQTKDTPPTPVCRPIAPQSTAIPNRHWINECVAVGDRILIAFVANSDEVFVVPSAKAAAAERPQPS
ncbi:hypothetical protein EOA60_12265 [Mesorhizobium sp. M1A.F.Ca.IN.020.06.1.1]|uniref:hypothetical protein n=1 Tax=unclassified Mesorhizobium TaxID=325217 RepID=UPI000FCB4891|nr:MULTISPECIES: hypothetical protein [unclassified Mesorhizobium]RUV81567.1 hypothetical protein EOA51_30950 [Mesorhizobium sp. M1A.F.Ca.IN.020.32.1.1]RUW03954.1 hypothetical protein EOA46_31675 [Mesorhizobium sp. M1A.F.Ca.IN.022.05.2.1]RUW31013.1 hypothetical protein EOA60_12265 [Mesorhizobium sp. M1A.F.Ca.IN.020.06.1.1]RWF82904.1 MAG: hypothetical protein EOQ35_08250 [Mesorhizobium sp.]RWG05697.1 MAG: hypothetical protein EOQ38_03455 [Mesorhizobium sp.]